jgi:hypothetical protein
MPFLLGGQLILRIIDLLRVYAFNSSFYGGGPYHVTATNKRKGYLTGEKKPDYVARKAIGQNEPARVHLDGHWISPREVQFTVSCCGTNETITYTLPEK